MFHRSWKRKKNKKRVPSAGVFDIFPFRNSQRKIDPRGHDWKELDSLLGRGEGRGGGGGGAGRSGRWRGERKKTNGNTCSERSALLGVLIVFCRYSFACFVSGTSMATAARHRSCRNGSNCARFPAIAAPPSPSIHTTLFLRFFIATRLYE